MHGEQRRVDKGDRLGEAWQVAGALVRSGSTQLPTLIIALPFGSLWRTASGCKEGVWRDCSLCVAILALDQLNCRVYRKCAAAGRRIYTRSDTAQPAVSRWYGDYTATSSPVRLSELFDSRLPNNEASKRDLRVFVYPPDVVLLASLGH